MALNEYAQKMLPMKHYNTPNGECIEYEDIVKFTITLFKAFGLDEKATRSVVDIALTLDGSSLTKNHQFAMAGIKLVDCAVQDPYTGKYDLKPISGDKWFLPQSRKWCFPVKICMGKETEKMYQEELKKYLSYLTRQANRDNRYSQAGKDLTLRIRPIWPRFRSVLALVEQQR